MEQSKNLQTPIEITTRDFQLKQSKYIDEIEDKVYLLTKHGKPVAVISGLLTPGLGKVGETPVLLTETKTDTLQPTPEEIEDMYQAEVAVLVKEALESRQYLKLDAKVVEYAQKRAWATGKTTDEWINGVIREMMQ